MNHGTPSRVGTFFILAGLILLLIFVASVAGQGENKLRYLFFGLTSLVLGFLLNRRPPSQTPGGRFNAIRQLRENDKKRREDRAKKKQERKKK